MCELTELQHQVASQKDLAESYQEEAASLRSQLEESSLDLMTELESLITDISNDAIEPSMASTACSGTSSTAIYQGKPEPDLPKFGADTSEPDLQKATSDLPECVLRRLCPTPRG